MSKILTHLLLEPDIYELNPLLAPLQRATVKVTGVTKDGQKRVLLPSEVSFSVSTIMTSGQADVAAIDSNGIVTPMEGGIARIRAEILRYGHSAFGTFDVIVRPFYHEYHKTFTIKLFLGMDDIEVIVDPTRKKTDFYNKNFDAVMTFEEVLDNVRRLDQITYGMPKIIYLVGWQKGGHDHGYPSFDEVNPKLKRSCDSTAADSLRWLIREGFKYNTSISLHININDTYPYSKLYDEYNRQGILMNDTDWQNLVEARGSDINWVSDVLKPGKPVMMKPLWETGAFKKRMNELLEMIPELIDTHTIHFDNWVAQEAPNQGISQEDNEEAIRSIFRYMRQIGFDITSEGSYHGRTDPMAGLQPMAWWNYLSFLPPSLSCGGRADRVDSDPRFGDSTLLEDIIQDNYIMDRHPTAGVLNEFCLYTLPWYFLNCHRLIDFDGTVARYTHDVTATIEKGIPVIRKGNRIVRIGTTLLVPVLWKNDDELFGYSMRGGNIWTELPESWNNVSEVDLFDIDEKGERDPVHFNRIPVVNGQIEIHLRSRQAFILRPVHCAN